MKIKANFICETHQDYGTLGWRLVNRPNFDPLNGMAIPHDMMEHGAHDTGSVEEELQALGALVLVRDNGAYFASAGSRDTRPAYHVAGDLHELLGRYLDGRELRTPPKTKPCEIIDDMAEELFIEFEKNEKHEFEPIKLTGELKANITGWLRIGYTKALRRFKEISPYILCEAFKDAAKQADRWEQIEGMVMSICIEVNTGGHYVFSEEKYA